MIAARSLQYRYSPAVCVELPDVVLPQGAVLLLKGDSGSGKSTFLALASGLLTPSAGRIVVAGQDLAALQGAARDAWRGRTVGFLPQRLHLSASLSVQDNLGLAYFAAGLPLDKARIHHCLQELGVAELAGRKPFELSGGQAQRVALARTVLLEPKVILADEPTASLDDVAATQSIVLLVQQARRSHASVVIATHDARVGQSLEDKKIDFSTIFMSKIGTLSPSNMHKQL